MPTVPATDAMDTMCPFLILCMSGRNSLMVYRWASVFTSRVLRIMKSEFSRIDLPETMPALFINIVTVPKFYLAILPASSIDSLLDTSHFMTMTCLSLLMAFTIICSIKQTYDIMGYNLLVSSRPSRLISERLNLAPYLAKAMAIYLPIPEPAPVRKTCSPLRDFLESHP